MKKTITVRALLRLLEDEDPDARVVFSSDYGDHSHTEQALFIRGDVEAVTLTRSAYSETGFAIVDEEDGTGNDGERVLVIR